MSDDEIWNWQCRMYLYTSYLYYIEDTSIWPDEMFDQHCRYLLKFYHKLPDWFKSRVDEDYLKAGTGFHLHFSEDEIKKAHEYRDFVLTLKARSTK